MSDFVLSREQQEAFNLIEGSSQNVLLIGKPGVGKSVLTRALSTTGQKYYTVGAPTGLAALNVGGKTLHSLFGISPSSGIFAADYNHFTTNDSVRNYIHHRLNHLIIDEISMVRADVFDYIDRELRSIKRVDAPFGGVQIIAVGDFFQLPPVAMTQDKKDLKAAGYASEFAFDSKIFADNFKVIVLEEVHRQTDPKFITILNAARTGNINAKHIHELNKQVGVPKDLRIKLTPTNKQADLVNDAELRKLDGKAETYMGRKYGYWPQDPVSPTLSLKVGAQVMVKKNRADRPPGVKGDFTTDVVNGTLAKIISLPSKSQAHAVVETDAGKQVNIYMARWERTEKKKVGESWAHEVVAWYEQYPLQLAWAISMHKSQGQTFDKVHIDGTKVFADGQMYVAVSRCRTLEGLSFETPLKERMFFANKDVKRFIKKL